MDSKNDDPETEPVQVEPDRKDFSEYASYEDGDSVVVCDRETTTAWVKSDVSIAIDD